MKRLPFLFLLFLVVACSKKTVSLESTTYVKDSAVYHSIEGVDEDLLSLDIYHFNNNKKNAPVIIYLHGGAWAIGDKSHKMQNKIDLFSSQGYVLVSANYRKSPWPPRKNKDDRIKFPDHNDDVAEAIVWVRDNIERYGGDNKNIVVLGFSAGAHLASLSGTSQEFLPKRGMQLSELKGVASIDIQAYDIENLMSLAKSIERSIYTNAFSSNPEVWSAASPQLQLEKGVSYPKFFIAKRGEEFRRQIADDFATALKDVGSEVTMFESDEYSHSQISEAIGKDGEEQITPALLRFLEDCFINEN